jgi:NhaP-type Na+/H+ or K+/H+ antiporter
MYMYMYTYTYDYRLLSWYDVSEDLAALEISLMLVFSYMPYLLAASMRLSGIMAIFVGGTKSQKKKIVSALVHFKALKC